MFDMIKKEEEPPSTTTSPATPSDVSTRKNNNIISTIFKKIFGAKTDPTLRETLEEYIEDIESDEEEESISSHEKTLISNILNLRDECASDVMIPRADIFAISEDTTQKELLALLAEKQYSRIPVYKDNLDNVIGSIHIKDILAALAQGKKVTVKDLVRNVPIVSPSMHVLDLLLQMRITRKHMVLVVDEFGGIDGLITIGDVIEIIDGEIDDEYDPDEQPEIKQQIDGTYIADARYDLEEFEEMFGEILTGEERDENDTLGGLVFTISGRVPARGEVLTHSSGVVFEITDADPRRVNRVRIRNIPESI